MPGVLAAAASDITPISGTLWNDIIKVDGYVEKSMEDNLVYFNEVTDRFFDAMGTPLLAGRDFDERDRPTSPPVAIVNETMARKFFRGASPLGKQYRVVLHDSLGPPIDIVGVVKDAKYRELREDILPTVYLAKAQNPKASAYAEYELRTTGPAAALIPGVKRTIATVNKSIAVELTPLSQQLDASLTRDRLLATLSGFFGALALLLAVVGLYGTLSYSVARRRNEIGIRIALGAAQRRVMQLVLTEVARMVIVGVALGAVIAVMSTRLVTSLLYGLSPSDPATMIASVVVLAAVALGAGALPAWRASRVDPITALRDE
jgi:predicted permease